MRSAALLFLASLCCVAAPVKDAWFARVEVAMNQQERQRYLSLENETEREAFRESFWDAKAVTAEQFFERVAYADITFGSGVPGSGANTDQGRVYIALGPPTNITQLPSSRILQPIEIWRYDHVAGLPVSSEIQLLFFRARGVGFPKLFSPQIHTVRALVINNAGTRGTFPVNDIVTADDLVNRLQLSPAELEAVDAAFHVARGVRGSGNSELIYMIASPSAMIRRDIWEKVTSHIYTALHRPLFNYTQYRTSDRVPAIDITLQVTAKDAIAIEVPGVESNETKLELPQPSMITYRQRLYLLPGTWNVVAHADGHRLVQTVVVQPVSDSQEEAPVELADQGTGTISIAYRVNLTTDAEWTSIARQYLRSDDRRSAAICFRKALAANPQNTDALAGQGKLLALDNQLDAARERLLAALRVQPSHYEALVALAAVTAKFQDHAEALKYYKEAQRIRDSGEIAQAIRVLSARAHDH